MSSVVNPGTRPSPPTLPPAGGGRDRRRPLPRPLLAPPPPYSVSSRSCVFSYHSLGLEAAGGMWDGLRLGTEDPSPRAEAKKYLNLQPLCKLQRVAFEVFHGRQRIKRRSQGHKDKIRLPFTKEPAHQRMRYRHPKDSNGQATHANLVLGGTQRMLYAILADRLSSLMQTTPGHTMKRHLGQPT